MDGHFLSTERSKLRNNLSYTLSPGIILPLGRFNLETNLGVNVHSFNF